MTVILRYSFVTFFTFDTILLANKLNIQLIICSISIAENCLIIRLEIMKNNQ
jgi:hypothetical protein